MSARHTYRWIGVLLGHAPGWAGLLTQLGQLALLLTGQPRGIRAAHVGVVLGKPVPQAGLGDRLLVRDRGDRLDPRTSEVNSALPELRRVRSGHEQHPSRRNGSASGEVSGSRGQAHQGLRLPVGCRFVQLVRDVTLKEYPASHTDWPRSPRTRTSQRRLARVHQRLRQR